MFSAATKTGSQPAVAKNYIEDVFSTYLYTGTGAPQTITNNIDLSGKGGLVWTKPRNANNYHLLFDTQRGATNFVRSTSTGGQITQSETLTSFNNNGFSLGSDAAAYGINVTSNSMVSWTFAEQSKFFDVVTYTGTGSNTTISHNLGSVPGMIIVKRTDTTGAWQVYHRSLTNTQYMVLNTTAAVATGATRWNSTTPTSSVFSLGTDATVNASGGTYVAYLFAHNAGGFGTTGTDNVISCGSYTANGSVQNISLGYEPQWLMVKPASGAGGWIMQDVMREMSNTSEEYLFANLTSAAANDSLAYFIPTATGFTDNNLLYSSGTQLIYMAIRRPMKVPTTGTSVFSPVVRTGTGSATTISGLNATDTVFIKSRNNGAAGFVWGDRLRSQPYLNSSNTAAESADSIVFPSNPFDVQNGVKVGTATLVNSSSDPFVDYFFTRRPGFFDTVCYAGTGSETTFNHNLGVAPELMIVKRRTGGTGSWAVYVSSLGAGNILALNLTIASTASSAYWNTNPTSSVFTVVTDANVNDSASTYVAYLFATCPGVSKVGSYTGNGTTQAIACGFTGGARFVLIKRTDSTGDWYVYDTARGMTTLTDPYLRLNSAGAEAATLGSVTTTAGGFTVNAAILAAINTNAASYIFLAIA